MPKASKRAGAYPERKRAAIFAKVDVWQGRSARLLVILLLCVQPLFFSPERYINLTLHKYQFFCVSMVIVLVVVMTIWIYRLTQNPRLLPQMGMTVADWAVIGFAAVTLLSALFSPFKDLTSVWVGIPEPEGRYDGAITQLLFVAAFFIVSRWYKPRTNDFVVFGISAILVALIGVFQFYGMDFFNLWPNHMDQYRVPNFYGIFFRSTLGNVDIVSTYVCVAILLCGFMFVRMKSKWQPLWLAASALNFWLMELANADSGRVGVLAAMVLAVPFIVENRKTLGRTLVLGASWIAVYALQMLLYDVRVLQIRVAADLRLYAVAAAALLVVGALLMFLSKKNDADAPAAKLSTETDNAIAIKLPMKRWLPGVILSAVCIVTGVIGIGVIGGREEGVGKTNRVIHEAYEMMHGNFDDSFGSYRMHIWKNALDAVPNYPIIGTGPDTFYYAFPEEEHAVYGGVSYDKAHNEYLQILICQGFAGLICYLVFLVAAPFKSVPRAFSNPMLMAALAAFIGYCIQAFFNISLPIASQMMWVLAGFLANKRFWEETALPSTKAPPLRAIS